MSVTIGITGPTGAGKSAVSSYLEGKGYIILDCDRIYADLTSGPSPCMDALKEKFGEAVVNEKGGLDRAAMRKLVFGPGNEKKLGLLNRTTHCFVTEELRKLTAEGREPGYVIDAPLLFEAGADIMCDGTIGIVAPYRTRFRRLLSRDGLSAEDIKKRMDSGHKNGWYRKLCTYTVRNSGSIGRVQRKTDRAIAGIRRKKG